MSIDNKHYLLNKLITMFVVETCSSSQFASASVFSSSGMSLASACMNLPELSIVCRLYVTPCI